VEVLKVNDIMDKVATIAVAIIGVATLAVLVSKNANTSGVIDSAGKAFSGALSVAVSPVTGSGGGLGGVGFTPPF
jgi:hypothetical protein